MKEFEGFVVG